MQQDMGIRECTDDAGNAPGDIAALREKYEALLAEKDARINTLANENSDLMYRCRANEQKITRLAYWAQRLPQLENELKLRNSDIVGKDAELQQLRELVSMVKEWLESSNADPATKSFKALQILHDPAIMGFPGKMSALSKLISAKLGKREFCPEYQVYDKIISDIDGKLFNISHINIDDEPEKLTPPDESVLISIVLPVYNQADLVHESIDSILAQTYRNWELIIINDGSTDDLAGAVKPYLADKRIHYLEQKNQRLPKALSNGFSFVSGDLLTWTSADNNMRPQMLERLSAFMRQHVDVALVYADYMAIDDKGDPLTAEWFRPQNKRHPNSPELHLPQSAELLNIIQDNFLGASFMYRRSTLKLIGDYDPQLGVEDYDYWMRINSMMRVSHLGTDEVLYDYRVHDNSLNAKAAEFKIAEKVAKLMEYEKERYAFYYKPFEVYGSFKQSDLYYGDFPYNFHEGKYEGTDIPDARAKRILLVKGSELADYTPQELERYNFIGAYFNAGEANDVGKNSYVIRRFDIQCFGNWFSPEMQRLELLSRNCFVCAPPETAFFSFMAANNRMFFNMTRTVEERTRVMPLAPCTDPGKLIILLETIGNGGMEQVAYDMVKAFIASGRDAVLVSVNGKQDDVKVPEGVPMITLDGDDKEAQFRKLLSDSKCDAVFSHYCTWGAKETFEANVPFFQVVHNTYVWYGADDIAKYTYADQFTSGYIAVSARVAWYAIERMGLPADKMMIIENGVDFSRFDYTQEGREKIRKEFGFTDDNFVILNPASCYGTKGQMNLVLAFAQAYKKNPALRLVLAGKILEPEYYNNIRKVISELQLEDVIFTGCFFENMAEVYSACDAVALPSFWEGCSLAVAESVHMRKPILATRVGDIERQTNCRNCVLFDLPFRYFTEFTGENCGAVVYSINKDFIDTIEQGILKLVAKDYPPFDESLFFEQSSEEAYGRYLKLLNYYKDNFPIVSFRHNI